MRIVVLCIGAILLLGACSTGKSFYLGNAVTEYTEEDDIYWTLVNFGNANVRELVRKNKVGVTPKKGTPKFKGDSDYDLSQFNFVEARRHHGQRVMIQRFRAIRLQKTMRIEGLTYTVYEFTANKGRVYHTIEFRNGKYVTDDKDVARAMKKRFMKKHPGR